MFCRFIGIYDCYGGQDIPVEAIFNMAGVTISVLLFLWQIQQFNTVTLLIQPWHLVFPRLVLVGGSQALLLV